MLSEEGTREEGAGEESAVVGREVEVGGGRGGGGGFEGFGDGEECAGCAQVRLH